jgi:hypothetical protein
MPSALATSKDFEELKMYIKGIQNAKEAVYSIYLYLIDRKNNNQVDYEYQISRPTKEAAPKRI